MITITSTFTADPLRDQLELILMKFKQQKVVFFYNQIFQQLLLPTSELNTNNAGINVIIIRLFDLFDLKHPAKNISEKISDLTIAFQAAQKQMKVPLLTLLTPNEYKNAKEKAFFENIEENLRQNLEPYKNIFFVNSQKILETFRSDNLFDHFSEKHGHIPYSVDFYQTLATTIARKYSLLTRKPYKVIVLDCDGTLWDGVIEEEGIAGIRIDEHYTSFHQFIIECYKAGFLICLCSKNSEQSVLDVFRNHKNMLLNLEEHICTYRINWETKSKNIQSIAKELDLGLDSFIFIDDNKIECAEVKAEIPEVLAIELPKDKNDRLFYLKNIWAFDYLSKNSEDANRTKFYQDNKLREQVKTKSTSYTDFLKHLKIKTTISYAKNKDYERVFQLSQRTNQFNIYPNSMTAIEFTQSIKTKNPHCLIINVRDKFGDYGLVGVIVYEVHSKELVIKAFFLSCRILGRGVEHEIIKHLSEVSKKHQIKFIHIPFVITQRNIPAMNFLKKLAGLNDLKNITKIVIKTQDINQLSFLPKESEILEQPKTTKKSENYIPNDYMLEIALQTLEYHKRPKQHDSVKHASKIVKPNLIDLFTRHNIDIAKDDIPLSSLGVDSLRSVLIASEIYRVYQVSINPFDLLGKKLTFDQLFNQITKKTKTKKVLIKTSVNSESIPLSYPQKRLWYDEKIAGLTNKNNMFVAYEISTSIQVGILEAAFIELIARHEVFRFSFHEKNDEPFIKLHSTQNIKFNVQHLKTPSLLQQNKFIEDFKYKVFDLAKAPLIRVGLITKANNKCTLLLSIHHIIHDGWSLGILLSELSILYASYLKKICFPFMDQAPSFIEFSHWQQKHISSRSLMTQKKFWEKFLYKIPKLELIYDNPRQEFDDKTIAKRIGFKLDATTTKKLKALAKNNNVTLYELLISTFGLLLAHYSNQDDISFVTAFSGRHNLLTGNMIGFFVNLVLLRFSVGSKTSFSDILRSNKKILSDIVKNQDLPFSEILQITGENISSKIHTFSQAGFIFQNYPIPELIINGQKGNRILSDDSAELLYDSCQECRFGNIVCFMQELESNLHGLFEYNAELFNEKTIHHIILSFKTLLKNIIKEPDCPALSIELVNEQQKKLLLNKWSKPVKEFVYEQDLISCFWEQVTKNPNNIAVQHNNDVLRYRALDKKSNQLAHKLKKFGIKFEKPVGVFLDKKIEYIIAILAIIKSGGCYVPIEKDQPITRINYIIDDVCLSHLISDTIGIQYICDNIKKSIFTINIDEEDNKKTPNTPINIHHKKNQLAYIMYTSGSTGNPKGVMIEQPGILRLVKKTNYIKVNRQDRIAQASSIVFDAATFEIWGALLNGARLVITDKHTLLDPDAFHNFLKSHKISILFLTTQLFHSYSHSKPKLFGNLKYLVIGGEALLADSVRNIFKQPKHPKYLINGYGPTENTTFSTTYFVKNHKDISNPLPIGKPISNTHVYILGANLQPVPVGSPGKLYLSGPGLTRGYLNLKHLNNKKFIHHFGDKLYKTGDIVVWQSDGNIRYLGREDNQIKINGYRIELDEIESHLEIHPLVEQAIVLVKSEHQQLMAYVQLKDNKELSEINLYHYLKLTLPKYMIPSLYYQIKDIPMTNMGKIDKDMLVHTYIHPISYTEYETPSSLLQNEIAVIFSQILKIEHNSIGVNTEFFDLGGNSISALTLIHMISEKFNVKINFSELYENSTIKLLSEKINHLINDSRFISKEQNISPKNSLKMVKIGDSQNMPIVFIHPIGGTGFCYLDLIKLLPNEQPCYIVQDPSIDTDQILFDDIPSMAQHYNALLLEHFQSEKFILAGFSFGGMLSMEMVYQLEQKKLSSIIQCIFAFDTWVVSNFMDAKAKEALKKSILQQYDRVTNNLVQENIDPKPWMELYYFRLQELGFTYMPPKINKKIILFKAIQQAGEFAAMNDPVNYLGAHTTEQVDAHMIPGNHDTILQQPNVKYISEIIKGYLKS